MNKDIYQEFFVACKNGDIEFINKNIDKIEDINHPDLNGSTALMISQFFHHNNISNVLIEHGAKLVLHEAVKDGNIKIIELVLKIPFLNINAVDLTGKTALHYAVMNNNQAIVTLLIKTGSNVNLLDQDHLTPLLIAARNGYLKMAKILIKSGADITIQNLNGMNCLHYSILYSHVDIFKFILKHISSNPETMKILNQQNEFDETPLHCSVENKNQQFITQLIAIGSDVNIQNKQGKTPFHLSIAEEKIGFVGLFFRKEAKVQVQINTQDKDGKTPLIDSIDLGNSFLISILLSYFADANIFDNKGFNAFHHAIIKNQPNTLTHLLRDSRSSPLSTTDGIPCLHLCAICNENMECFDILMKFLKSPSYKEETDREGNTILHHAAKNSRKQFITKHKEITDINKQNEEGNTVLHIIATTGNTELMLQIIRETNINIENKKKQTPLHLSCFNGNYECSKILISYGAKLDQQDDQQHTPLFLALSKGFIDIVELLLDNGAMEQVFDAVKNSNMEIANIYVELGFPSWVNNKESKNLLHYAVEANNIEIAKKIIPTCKNINIRNGNGMNAIQIASKNGFFEICEILIEYGANLIHYTDIMQRPHILAENHKHKKCAQFIKKHFMRDFSIFELIDTEKNYLRILSGLISKIIDPLSNRTSSIEKNNPMISKDQLELIFSNIQNIYQDGSLFLSNLLERFKNWNPKKGVGDIAKNHIPQFVSNYIIYNNNFDRSIQTLKQARKQNHSFANFLKIQEQDPFFQRLELDAILIQPVQRIGQYKLLFEQIQKYTDESHPDYQDLTDALEIVNKFGNQVNETKRIAEEHQKLISIQTKLSGKGINLLDQSHRRLIQEGFITFQFLERKSNRFLSPVSRDMKQKAHSVVFSSKNKLISDENQDNQKKNKKNSNKKRVKLSKINSQILTPNQIIPNKKTHKEEKPDPLNDKMLRKHTSIPKEKYITSNGEKNPSEKQSGVSKYGTIKTGKKALKVQFEHSDPETTTVEVQQNRSISGEMSPRGIDSPRRRSQSLFVHKKQKKKKDTAEYSILFPILENFTVTQTSQKYCFLFNDCLLICDTKKHLSEFIPELYIPLHDLFIKLPLSEKNADIPKENESFFLFNSEHSLLITPQSKLDFWFEKIQRCIDDNFGVNSKENEKSLHKNDESNDNLRLFSCRGYWLDPNSKDNLRFVKKFKFVGIDLNEEILKSKIHFKLQEESGFIIKKEDIRIFIRFLSFYGKCLVEFK